MPFRVTARTLLHLGGELISSDAIAFYELIKNAFDAGSFDVGIELTQSVPFDVFTRLWKTLKTRDGKISKGSVEAEEFEQLKREAIAAIDRSLSGIEGVVQKCREATSWRGLKDAFAGCNFIDVVDWGCGMSLQELDEVFLTVGTRSKLKLSEASTDERLAEGKAHPLLGEKGLGRLSVMRLGERVRIETSKSGEKHQNVLEIDWSHFSHDSDKLIEEVPVEPVIGPAKSDPNSKGTTIRILALNAAWSFEKLRDIAVHEFSKLQDPFAPASRYSIDVRFNGRSISIPRLAELLFEHAHATVQITYDPFREMPVQGLVDYKMRRRTLPIAINLPELVSLTQTDSWGLRRLGPFEMTMYWFNRQLLRKELNSIGEKQQVLDIQEEWSGGLKLYRDGFRVNPYGNKNDDWLDLDRKALASGGYKVNRAQIVGRVSITKAGNPALVDQTNREGLQDCPEKHALIAVLKSIIESRFRTFLNQVDKEKRAQDPLTFDDLGKRVLSEEEQLRKSLDELVKRHPEIENETEVVRIVSESTKRIRDLIGAAQELADSVEEGHGKLLHLAGLGLMVEILAHELTRTTQNTLNTVSAASKSATDRKMISTFKTLEAQLKTLERRLRVLDPLSVSGRQRKEQFDLLGLAEDVIVSHSTQFERHGIKATVSVVSPRPEGGVPIKAVKGMIIQIMENLLNNSVYWLKVQKRVDRTFAPYISVEIDHRKKALYITDNGPGIDPEQAEEIFEAFVSNKPPGEGKGLGLYISREIAQYNGATLSLVEDREVRRGRLNTFVLQLGG